MKVRVVAPALFAFAALLFGSVSSADAGLFSLGCGGCDCGPTCGAPAAIWDSCCTPSPSCCNVSCCAPRCGLGLFDCLKRACKPRCGGLFGGCNDCCDSCEPACGAPADCGCEPACGAPADCGCEPACGAPADCGCESAPSCGCDPAPSCGCEPVSCCDPCCSPCKKRCGFGLLKKLFSCKKSCCASSCCNVCDPCNAPIVEPSCGCH